MNFMSAPRPESSNMSPRTMFAIRQNRRGLVFSFPQSIEVRNIGQSRPDETRLAVHSFEVTHRAYFSCALRMNFTHSGKRSPKSLGKEWAETPGYALWMT